MVRHCSIGTNVRYEVGQWKVRILINLTSDHAVIPCESCSEKAYEPAHTRAREMGAAARTAHINRRSREWVAFRFKEPDHAEAIAREFGGETCDVRERGKAEIGGEKITRLRLIFPNSKN